MPPFWLIAVGLLGGVFIGVALLVPAGYGLPAPIFGVIGILLALPALLVGLFIYLRMVRRGQLQAFGAAKLRREASDREGGEEIPPAHQEAQRRVRRFRRASGKRP